MPNDDEALARLRAAVDHFAAADVSQLIEEARAEARGRVRSILSDALTGSLLAQTRAELERHHPLGAPAEPAAAPVQPRSGNRAWYVYGIVRAEGEAVVNGLRGIADEPVQTIAHGRVAAVYSHVPGEEFDEAELRTHLSDMAWVEQVARGHEAVLDELCSQATVIPMRMCTVYKTEARVREMLEREQGSLEGAIELLEGKREWGLQAFFRRDRVALDTAAGEASDAPGGSTASAGASYMQRRRRERDSAEQLEQVVNDAAQEIHDSLAAITADSALNPPQRPEANRHSGEMVLNGVYLVEDSAKELFDSQVRELQSRFSATGLELLITGPWPPYNFLPGSIGAAW